MYKLDCTVKPVYKMATLKKTENWFSRPLSLNAGQKYSRMLQVEHSAILLTFIKVPFVIKIFVLSIFEWPFYTGFTEQTNTRFIVPANYRGLLKNIDWEI